MVLSGQVRGRIERVQPGAQQWNYCKNCSWRLR
jgi:hypothetical protein